VVGDGVQDRSDGAGNVALLLLLLLLLLAPEEGPRSAKGARVVAALLLLLRDEACVDAARGGERGHRGTGADGG
jgi:hypothetical protein